MPFSSDDGGAKANPGSSRWAKPEPGSGLGVVVGVVVMTMMVSASGERGASNYQQQQGGENELLHAMQISTIRTFKYAPYVVRIKSDTVQNGTENSST